ncbi:hypothetical protein RUND412_009522 [Rhizina undulata]
MNNKNWLYLSIGSGLAAGLNGLFAKLVTTTLTTSLASSISEKLGLDDEGKEWVVEYGVRGIFFLLNLLFNGFMWGLFTAALRKGSSATKVSIVNTSSNFMITAILGYLVFSESLPPLWWLGASLLVAGNVIIGRREEPSASSNPPHSPRPTRRRKESVNTDTPETATLMQSSSSDSELDTPTKKPAPKPKKSYVNTMLSKLARVYSTTTKSLPLASQRILITGGSRGIGLGIAKRFAELGGSCTLISRDEGQLKRAVGELYVTGGQEHEILAGDVKDWIFWVKSRKQNVDVLVNAAGITHSSLLMSTSPEVIENVVGTNLVGSILGCQAVSRNMVRRKGGCIINISSILSHHPKPGVSIYAATKSGVLGLTRSLALELGPSNIRVNAILPGYISTDMTDSFDDNRKDTIRKATPLKRFGTVEDVADVAEFLVRSRFVTGAEIVVDGGLSVGVA